MIRTDFSREIALPGWSPRSAWGYDQTLEAYWAVLWRDGDPPVSPPLAISTDHLVPTIHLLTELLARRLSLPEADVAAIVSSRRSSALMSRVRRSTEGAAPVAPTSSRNA